MTPDKDKRGEELPKDAETEFDMKLGFRVGRISGKHRSITMVVWGEDHHYPADIAHRTLWEKLVQTYNFLMGSFHFSDPDVGKRWERVKEYVLNGGDIDASLLNK